MQISDSTYWYIFNKGQILLRKDTNDNYSIPYGHDAPIELENSFIVEMSDGRKAMTGHSLIEDINDAEYDWVGLRASWSLLETESYEDAGKAYQLIFWDLNSRFCPRCGTPTRQDAPIMKRCPNCKNEIFPSVSPAILVLVRKEDKILMVHARNFKGSFYGLVAGFVETGETLEQCVHREVMEETGLKIKNLKYFGNQPWPYPSNLMLGFIADYESGEIKLQEDELSAAGFFAKDNLPERPSHPSLARKMIDWWIAQE